ncbi:ATP synthase gamma chain, chloroplastic [Cinnamomum micranthum f. kanehirae]|uniref:F-ATPase gamma subunit n=1 Tax=Cinnamomum micranthum f. kanehirae TaxID=337451 RepID=A0A443Q0T2_9MAGN|nr:ATP synthase gamma chain, chloroplastic [Cinnamomum micranthum f. kanehirae]
MSISNLTMWVTSKPSLSDQNPLSSRSHLHPFRLPTSSTTTPTTRSSPSPIHAGLRELRERINSVKNTQKITEAMKLVAAAKVRRAQEAVVNGRPFSESLVEVLYNINENLQTEDIDVPLTRVRPVKKVALVVVTGDRGLCGGFNNFLIKKAESRIRELKELGVAYTIISVGKKGNSYFLRRPYIPVDRFLEGGSLPTTKEAQAIADDVFSLFVSEEVDKVELLYTKFVSLVKSDPVIHTLLPLSPKGEICDLNGNCVDAADDELFRLTTKEGKLTVERDTILRALQESLASELAARMSAMSNATDNAMELKKSLSMAYNRQRQAKITGEILEIVAGANALT